MTEEKLFSKIADLASRAEPLKIDVTSSVMQQVRKLPLLQPQVSHEIKFLGRFTIVAAAAAVIAIIFLGYSHWTGSVASETESITQLASYLPQAFF